jgi:hypothetical protein
MTTVLALLAGACEFGMTALMVPQYSVEHQTVVVMAYDSVALISVRQPTLFQYAWLVPEAQA